MANRSRFRTVEKLAIYYGRGSLDRLIRYDAVVIEPSTRSPEEIQALKAAGVLVVAYISVMEVHEEHPLWKDVSVEDYIRSARNPNEFLIQPVYKNNLVDLQSTRWRGLLLRHAGELITKHGYDGVFLDTIGDVEMTDMPLPMQQIEAAAAFVEDLRKWFPEAVIVQNNGLEVLCMRTAPYLDAIAWENAPIDIPESKRWVEAVAERLMQLRIAYNLRVFLLFEGTHQDTRADFLRGRSFADKYGFVAYFSPVHYQSFHR